MKVKYTKNEKEKYRVTKDKTTIVGAPGEGNRTVAYYEIKRESDGKVFNKYSGSYKDWLKSKKSEGAIIIKDY